MPMPTNPTAKRICPVFTTLFVEPTTASMPLHSPFPIHSPIPKLFSSPSCRKFGLQWAAC
jgi:hypothetical protein